MVRALTTRRGEGGGSSLEVMCHEDAIEDSEVVPGIE